MRVKYESLKSTQPQNSLPPANYWTFGIGLAICCIKLLCSSFFLLHRFGQQMWSGVCKRGQDVCRLLCPPTKVFSVICLWWWSISVTLMSNQTVTSARPWCDAVVLIPSRRRQDIAALHSTASLTPAAILLTDEITLLTYCLFVSSFGWQNIFFYLSCQWTLTDVAQREQEPNLYTPASHPSISPSHLHPSVSPLCFLVPPSLITKDRLLMLLFLKRRSVLVSPIKALTDTWWGGSSVAAVQHPSWGKIWRQDTGVKEVSGNMQDCQKFLLRF